MSQPETSADLSVGLVVNEQKTKQAADSLIRHTERIGTAGKKVEDQLKKTGKALENIQARAAGKVAVVGARTAGEAETALTRGRARLAEQEAKTLTKIVEGEQRRATLIVNEESKKRLHIFRQEHRVKAQVSAGFGGRGGAMGVIGRLFGGGGGGIAGGLAAGLLGGLGIGTGGYALARGAEGTLAAVEQATAYDRQRLAAEKLAGSQAKLQSLMVAYARASGGAVNETTSLANVTRLLSTGFANTAPQMERFVRSTRGAAIALGKPQEDITQETQLAISNTSVKRLDQIGLGIKEVTDRIDELRDKNSGLSREMAFQQAVLGLLDEKYGDLAKSAEGQATAVEKLTKAWEDLGLAFGQVAQGPVNNLATTLTFLLNATGVLLAREIGKLDQYIKLLRLLPQFRGLNTSLEQRALELSDDRQANAAIMSESIRSRGITFKRPEDQQSLIDAAYDNIQQVERQANKARLQEIENYESQRESIINNYGKMVVREEQDFVRQRARSLRDYERAIVDVLRDRADREAEAQEDLDERLAEAREDSEERLSDVQEKYNENREKSEREHMDNMLKAVGQGDAIAVLEERKAFRRQQEEAKKQHDEAISDEKEALQERIDDALEAHQEQLEDAREADEKRLEDMRVNRERQLADEDEDRRIRLERAAEDHQDQLNELDRLHAERMTRIQTEMEEETAAIEKGLADDLAALGRYIAGVTEAMNERKKLQEEWFDALIERMEKDIEEQKQSTYRYDPEKGPQIPHSYARGGAVANTGLAYLHAGEYVIPAGSGGDHYNSNRSINIEQLNISTTPGMEYMVGDLVEEKLIELLDRV